MAQQDTGLGWSAKSDWLTEAAGRTIATISYIGGPDFPNQPMNSVQAISDVLITNGTPSVVINNTQTQYMCNYIAPDLGYPKADILICYVRNGSYYRRLFITNVSGAVCAQQVWNSSSQSYSFGGTTAAGNSYSSTYGLYYRQGNENYNIGNVPANIPIFDTQAQAFAAVQRVNVTFTKDNAGFAVACLAKWRTETNVLIQTPVLISSVSENTDMTSSSSLYNLAKLNIRRDGITFYMSFFDIIGESPTTDLHVADMSLFNLDLDKVFNTIAQSGMANIQVTETVDPYEDFGYNGEDAGEINPDPQDDDIDIDDLPTKSFATAGFCRIFNPDISDLNDLSSYMWTDQTFLQTVINHLKQIIENPIEAIISLSMVPVQPPTGSSKVPVKVMFVNTGVSMYPVTNQFVSVDCGTTVLQECYGGALDYNPYTRVQIYLPYIGTVQLDTDEVMGKTLHLQYHVDVVTGICCAEIKADNKLLYQFSGHCAVSQPITSADFSSYLNAAIAATKVAVALASGSAEVTAGAAAATTPIEVPSSTSNSKSLSLVPSSSGPVGPHLGSSGGSNARADFLDIPEPSSGGGVSWGELTKPGNVNTVASTMGGKMVVQHSGGFSGNSGYLAKRRPYLIVIRPRIANPRNYAQHFGRTSMEYLSLGSCTGYTKVQSVHLSGFDATNPELSEISSLLKGGVLM